MLYGVIELHEAEDEGWVGAIVQPVGGEGDDAGGHVREPHVGKRLRAVGVRRHGDPAFRKLHVTLGVAAAHEAHHVAPVAFEHRRGHLLVEFGARAPVEIDGTGQVQEADIVGERGAVGEGFSHCPGARHLPLHLEQQRVAATAEAGEEDNIAGLRAVEGEGQREERMSGTEIPRLRGEIRRHVRGGEPESSREGLVGAGGGLDDGAQRDFSGGDLRLAAGLAHHWGDQLRHRYVTHEALLGGIGGGMLARGVDVREIMGEAGSGEKPGCALVCHDARRTAVAIGELSAAARLRRAPFTRGDEAGTCAFERHQECGNRATAGAGDVEGDGRAGQRQRIHEHGRMAPLEEGGGGGGEDHLVGCRCAVEGHACRLDGERHRILVPAGDGAEALPRAGQAGPFQSCIGRLAAQPEQGQVAPDAGD